MAINEYNVIGVMSGTSLDGIDLVYANFQFDRKWSYKIIFSETVNYNSKWADTLKNLIGLSLEKLIEIDKEYTVYLANRISEFITTYKIINIDAICSHGHTALHQPDEKLTYQIGNLPNIATILKHKVVCDFRIQDVQLYGQGAPLVPIGDDLLFSEYDYCLNLGGFANVSTRIDGKRIAYDICPVNIVLNNYVKLLGFEYDDKGAIALTGIVNKELLKSLNNLNFYKETYPKSLGLEWVNTNVFPLIDSFGIDVKDVLRTFVEHIVIQIASEINKKNSATVFVTGGGVYNTFLIERLKFYLDNKIVVPQNDIVEFKEALIFGFLGVLKLRNEVNCLSSVTGALKDHSSGKIYMP